MPTERLTRKSSREPDHVSWEIYANEVEFFTNKNDDADIDSILFNWKSSSVNNSPLITH